MSKTLIGVLASGDSPTKNAALCKIFKTRDPELKRFHFVFTGGTFDRLFLRKPIPQELAPHDSKNVNYHLDEPTIDFLIDCGVTRLPGSESGGVTILANLIAQRKLSLLWPFFSPLTTHLLFPENLSLLRLSDHCHVKKMMNTGSVDEWIKGEAHRDINLNLQGDPLHFTLRSESRNISANSSEFNTTKAKVITFNEIKVPPRNDFPELWNAQRKPLAPSDHEAALNRSVVALISHDAMKEKMIDFVIDYEPELAMFGKILATGTTGKLVGDAAPSITEVDPKKIHRYHSGPKGGDIEIATEILFGCCHYVVFFVDPLNPHPHTDDIRVVFAACMINDKARMLSNDIQARSWMNRIIKRGM